MNRSASTQTEQSQATGQIMVVDDDDLLLECTVLFLRTHGFAVRGFADAETALEAQRRQPADVILADLNMPRINGFQLVTVLREFDGETPVVMMTGNAELDVALSALRLRIFELLPKPLSPACLITALNSAMVHGKLLRSEKTHQALLTQTVAEKTAKLAEALRLQQGMSRDIIERLTHAAEFRDEDTGQHIARIGHYASRIAEALGQPQDFVETIGLAAAMHDIGKIGIPDAILFKSGPLTFDEFEIIKTHTTIGAHILDSAVHPLLQMAADIALTHHERWDGTGYPNGLRGEQIPLSGRIVMLADQYDALRSRRAYKPAIDHAATCRILLQGDDLTRPEHFDPAVLAVFRKLEPTFAEIAEQLQDQKSTACGTNHPVQHRTLPRPVEAFRLCPPCRTHIVS